MRKAVFLLLALSTFPVGSSAAARTVAVVDSGANRALVRVDPRTLEPVRGAKRIALPTGESFALSPDSTRVAIARKTDVVIADTALGHVLRRIRSDEFQDSFGLYWVGSSAYPMIVAVGSSKFGYEYTTLPGAGGSLDTVEQPAAAVSGSLVLTGLGGLNFLDRGSFVSLQGATPGPFSVIADVAGDRVYVVYNAGVVAKVAGNAVTYHAVRLEGSAFSAAWAGHDEIALWGVSGLDVIDTRTWTAHALASTTTGVVATRYGIVAWNANAIDGLSVYAPRSRRRMHILAKKRIVKVTALGRYAYARTGEAKQYAIDLETGRTRAIRTDAELAVPTLVPLP